MTHDDLAGLGRGLQATRGVHHVAHHRGITASAHRAHKHFTGIDPDAQREAVVRALRDRAERVAHAHRTPDRAFRVVFVRGGRTELRHDLVADDLVEAATVGGDHIDEGLETTVDEVLDRLGIARLRECGEADDVGHQHRDEAALVGPA